MAIRKQVLETHFMLAAKAMGWDTSPAYVAGRLDAHVGATFLQKHYGGTWSVSRITNSRGGETDLRAPCKAPELLAWLEGVCFAAWEFERRATVSTVPLGSTQ